MVDRCLDLSLKRLQTDYIDIYQFHQVDNEGMFQRVLGPDDDLCLSAPCSQKNTARTIFKSDFLLV